MMCAHTPCDVASLLMVAYLSHCMTSYLLAQGLTQSPLHISHLYEVKLLHEAWPRGMVKHPEINLHMTHDDEVVQAHIRWHKHTSYIS